MVKGMRKFEEISKKMNQAKTYIQPYKYEYIFCCIFVTLILFSTLYNDFIYTYRSAINFWYALTEGHPLSFYSYAKAFAGHTVCRGWNHGAAYDFTIYFIFAVWNLPAWIYERISGHFAESCLLWMIWAKLMFVPFAILCAKGMKNIYCFVTKSEEDVKTIVYAWSFSGFLLVSTYFVGQYDIIGVLFAIWGVYYYLKGDYKKFYLFFAVAITCKYFAVFIFIPLILLYEKRILRIACDVCCGFILVLAEKMLFGLGRHYNEIHGIVNEATETTNKVVGTGILGSRIQYLFYVNMDWGDNVLYLFVLATVAIYVYCYLQKREETYQFYYKVIYLCFAVYSVFLLFASVPVYWVILIAPWMVLVIYCRGNHRKINLLLETAIMVLFILKCMVYGKAFFNSAVFEGMTLYYLFGKPAFYPLGISSVMALLVEQRPVFALAYNLCVNLFVSLLAVMTVMNFPKKEMDVFVREPDEPGTGGVLFFRAFCAIGILMIPIVVYICQVFFEGRISSVQSESELVQQIIQMLTAYDVGPM